MRRSPFALAGIGLGVLGLAVLVVVAVSALRPAAAGPSPSPRPTSTSNSAPASSSPSGGAAITPLPGSSIPAFEHIYLIVMENHSYDSIVGSSEAPFLNSLIAEYGLATDYQAITSPSQPNYIALFSGSTQGVEDNDVHDLAGANLADQLEGAGRSWAVYAQNVPPDCFTGASAEGGADGPGKYVRKHQPAISFTSISGNPARCSRITDFSHFDPAAANFELIVPNLCNDMHDCSVATGDSFLSTFVPRITGSASFASSVLFITWDEGSDDDNHVATLVISPLVFAGARSDTPHDHYSLLRTIQEAWGLDCLNETCQANDLREFFGR